MLALGREERRLGVFQNRLLGRICGPMGYAETRHGKKFHISFVGYFTTLSVSRI
jgi:hypothetical protein